MEYRIRVVLDEDFDPGNYADNETEIRECVDKIRRREWSSYMILVEQYANDEWEHGDSLSGVATTSGYDDTSYHSRDEITRRARDEYLRGILLDMWPDETTEQPA